MNEDGQCGVDYEGGNSGNIYSPTIVSYFSLTRVIVTAVSTGSRHTLALSNDGDVYSWGWGHLGQLGHGDNLSVSHPRKIDSLAKITSVSAGGMHCGCIDETFNCYTWGACNYGQLGIGETVINSEMVSVPTKVRSPLSDQNQIQSADGGGYLLCSKISCGGMHTAAIALDGSVFCWGKADSGQTGFPDWYKTFFAGVYSPKKVYGFTGTAVDVACGGFHTLILTSNDTVFAMGKEDFGLLGTGNTAHNMNIGAEIPTRLPTFDGIKIVHFSAGGWHSCFVKENGTLLTCGKGEYGRLGLGNERSKTEPSVVNPLDAPSPPISPSISPSSIATSSSSSSSSLHGCPVRLVSAGGSHTLLCTIGDRIFSVGRMKVLQVCAGGSHSAVLSVF
eukprot:gene23166-31486_t